MHGWLFGFAVWGLVVVVVGRVAQRRWRLRPIDDTQFGPGLRSFVGKQVGVDPSRLRPTDSLLHDLGVDGDDSWEFMQHFSQAFGVDVTTFEGGQHFGPEAAPSSLTLYWLSVPRHERPRFVPITLADLDEAINEGRFVMPSAAPKR